MPAAPKNVPEDRLPRMRNVVESDLEAIALLDQQLFTRDAYSCTVLRQFYDLYARHFLVLDDSQGIQGYVLVGTAVDKGSWVLGLGVTPDRRGRGHGRRLMREVLSCLRADGVHTVRLSVAPANVPAIDLYRSLDFALEGELHKEYFGPGGDRLIMVRHL
ncbi:GNAT family N-acetyltransferase [Streptomyces sp. NL15-2K]|uniref:GNAT family N-acetyltransferase n=1 Tax=Streptomyces sp. NL15-2K TaxID=376149 RepID=UPI00209C232D|nr:MULTISPECIES: GNAT family N-acetyltransferase [Actinomycetes]WKX08557.1 GNAT family N-acetyltransferase [Kutzneria buriramensis]